MNKPGFSVVGARAEPYAAVPTLCLRLRIDDPAGGDVHAIVLRVMVQIEPRRRHYAGKEEERLFELFGEPRRWGDTLKNLVWAQESLTVTGFSGSTEVDVPIRCTYDFEIASSKYLSALEDGEIPLLLLFSGTIFRAVENGFAVEQIPWDLEVSYRLPVSVWRDTMNAHFPNTAWLRLSKDVFDELYSFKARRALPTWEEAIEALLGAARERR